MAQKKKVFSKVKAVKDAARLTVGTPKATRAIPDAKTKAETRRGKYKRPIASGWEDE